jgi:hypothetical protein
MKTLWPLVLGSALCLLLASCVTDSVNPLSSPDTAHAEPRLVGDWRGGTDSDPNTCRFSITKGAWMQVDIIHPKENREPNEPPDSYDFFPTVIGKNTFLNVVMIGKDDEGHPTKAYLFLRYRFDGNNVLHMWRMSDALSAAAIRAGKLKGLIQQNGVTVAQPAANTDVDVVLQDTGANIVKFIQNSDVDELFDNKMNGFYRVKPPGK